ncbi:hypothetical protein GE09DRAFT_561656 [Coniochaeta sp. 2T2.1]|nr:hypothetical protein GE09DRAFT_561656 [Coniochaeta sp. 2T2.1]
MLECRSSILALKMITRRIIDANQDIPELRNLKESDIEPKVNGYLNSVRRSFPHVVVTNRFGMATKNGRTNKQDCAGTFEPKTAAVIEINEMLMFRLADACRVLMARDSESNKRHFRNLHFRLSITMAHELVHVYNLFLRRGRYDHTPPHVTYGGHGDDRAGESGRYWEYVVLGGFVDMRDTTPNPADRMEAVAIRDSHGQKVWRIKADVIDGILERNFNRWLEPGTPLNDPEHPKNQFTELISTFDWKNRFVDIFPAPPKAEQGLQLSSTHIGWLTGRELLQSARYNMSGPDLRAFCVQPRTLLRQAVSM